MVDAQQAGSLPVQRLALYATAEHVYIVGSNKSQQTFRVLKFSRTDQTFTEDPTDYSRLQVTSLLEALQAGNANTGGFQLSCKVNSHLVCVERHAA